MITKKTSSVGLIAAGLAPISGYTATAANTLAHGALTGSDGEPGVHRAMFAAVATPECHPDPRDSIRRGLAFNRVGAFVQPVATFPTIRSAESVYPGSLLSECCLLLAAPTV